MGLFDKLSNLIFEEEPADNGQDKKRSSIQTRKGSWTDIFFEDVSEGSDSEKKRGKFSDLFFKDVSEEGDEEKKSFSDLFFEEVPDDDIKSTFVTGDDKTSVLDDISSKIERRESELINLAQFFKAVNPKDYPDSGPEYKAYISLVEQLNTIKSISSSSTNSTVASMSAYQLEANFRKFELDYQSHINAIQSLCYLSEISSLNAQMAQLFSSNFTSRTDLKIEQTEGYIELISKKSNKFDKKYSARLYKELIESEYRLTLLKLMSEIKNGRSPRRNPFASFSSQKKKTFETYLSKDLRDSNAKYNSIADGKEKYTRYGLVEEDFFYKLDADAEVIAERISKYTIDDFLLNELLENGDGFETLKRFLAFKLNLNYIDSKTSEAESRLLDDNYRRAVATGHRESPISRKPSTNNHTSKKGRKFPDFDDDL